MVHGRFRPIWSFGDILSKDNSPLVSILMCCYSEPKNYFKSAVDSILNQSYSNFELLLILDNPDNGLLRDMLVQYSERDNRVIPIINDRNLGLTGSLNKAIGLAKGDYFCRMDADDISVDKRIETQIAYLRSHDLDLVGSYLEVIGPDSKPMYQVDTIPVSPCSIAKALRFNNCVPHPSWFGKKSVFVEGYRGVPYAEDYDFLIRAVLRGCKLGNVPECLIRYRMNPDSISRSNLFKQFLTQIYLSRLYSRGLQGDLVELEQYIASNFSEKRDRHYSEANRLFNIGLVQLKQKKVFSGLFYMAHSMVVSLPYAFKLYRMMRATFCRI